MSIGLVVQINYVTNNNNVENKISTFTGCDIIDIKNILINFLFEELKNINKINDDLPFFTYYIFNQEWEHPWDDNDIYNIILKKLDEMPLRRTDSLSDLFLLKRADSY